MTHPDRFTLEERITEIGQVEDELDQLAYKIGDSPSQPTEDDQLNVIIGMKELCNIRYERLWRCFEECIQNGVIQTSTPVVDDLTQQQIRAQTI